MPDETEALYTGLTREQLARILEERGADNIENPDAFRREWAASARPATPSPPPEPFQTASELRTETAACRPGKILASEAVAYPEWHLARLPPPPSDHYRDERLARIQEIEGDRIIEVATEWQVRYNLQMPYPPVPQPGVQETPEEHAGYLARLRAWLVSSNNDPRLTEIDLKELTERRLRTRFQQVPVKVTAEGNGQRFVAWYESEARYVAIWKNWLLWSDKDGRWKRDELLKVREMAKTVVRFIYDEANHAQIPSHRAELGIWAGKCENPGSINQLLDTAASHPTVALHPEAFDLDPLIFNMANGFYDLRRNIFVRPHDRNTYCSMTCGYNYDPAATCPLWMGFLNRIFEHHEKKDEMIEFIQRGFGYTLTGRIDQRILFLLHGSGMNGKSVLVETLLAMMGEYGTTLPAASFTTAMKDRVRDDLAGLKGKRAVIASENSEGSVLDAETIKRLTGNDTIKARFLYEKDFEFKPTFKIWWVFNHKPIIKDTTASIWDRVRLIPFEERIDEDEKDTHLQEKLLRELPGIFNWALAGYFEIADMKTIPIPDDVKRATTEYRRDEDIIREFIEECFEITKPAEGIRCSNKLLWETWLDYAIKNKYKTYTKIWLTKKLDENDELKSKSVRRYRVNKEKGFECLLWKGEYGKDGQTPLHM